MNATMESLRNELFKIGEENKSITQDEIDNLLPDELFSPEEKTELLEFLDDMGVEIIFDNGNGNGNGFHFLDDEEAYSAPEYDRTGDLVHAYLHSLGSITLLNKSEEVELAKKMDEGREIIWALIKDLTLAKEVEKMIADDKDNDEEGEGKEKEKNEIRNLVIDKVVGRIEKAAKIASEETGLSAKGAAELWENICNKKKLIFEARDELIKRNLRLVINIAKSHVGKGLPLLDLIQHGNIGLIRAVDKFKYEKGFKFSTYATWWIRQDITRAIKDHSRTIRLPVGLLSIYSSVLETIQLFFQKYERMPEPEEIADEIKVPQWKIEKLLTMSGNPLSLHNPIFQKDNETELGDAIADKTIVSPDVEADRSIRIKLIKKALSEMPEKEAEVIRRRFCMGEGPEYIDAYSQEETAKHVGTNYNWVSLNEPMIMGYLRRRVKDLMEESRKSY